MDVAFSLAEYIFRFVHVAAGIVWIGVLLFTLKVVNSARAVAADSHALKEGFHQGSWTLFNGAFWRFQRHRAAPSPPPADLMTFRWPSLTTWSTGMLLLAVIYYRRPSLYLIDPQVMAWVPMHAVCASIASIVCVWLVYDWTSRLLLGRSSLAGDIMLIGIAAVTAWLLSHAFAPRAAVIHMGVIIGSIMYANIFFHLVPIHQRMIKAMIAGQEPDPADLATFHQRQRHSGTLFVFPAAAMMVAPHASFLLGARPLWLAILLVIGFAVALRFAHIELERGDSPSRPLAVAAVMIAAMPPLGLLAGPAAVPPAAVASASAVSPKNPPQSDARLPIEQADLIHRHCAACHSHAPRMEGFAVAPAGITLDTDAQILTRKAQICRVAVTDRTMPLGNITGMTEGDRGLMAQWCTIK